MEKEELTHNQLQAKCFTWMWNTYPELRGLLFSVNNNLTTQMDGNAGAIRMAKLKSLGVIRGTTDFIFYYKGRMYAWDIKVGMDKLRPEQVEFITKVKENGGDGGEVRSLEEFQEKIKGIIK